MNLQNVTLAAIYETWLFIIGCDAGDTEISVSLKRKDEYFALIYNEVNSQNSAASQLNEVTVFIESICFLDVVSLSLLKDSYLHLC